MSMRVCVCMCLRLCHHALMRIGDKVCVLVCMITNTYVQYGKVNVFLVSDRWGIHVSYSCMQVYALVWVHTLARARTSQRNCACAYAHVKVNVSLSLIVVAYLIAISWHNVSFFGPRHIKVLVMLGVLSLVVLLLTSKQTVQAYSFWAESNQTEAGFLEVNKVCVCNNQCAH